VNLIPFASACAKWGNAEIVTFANSVYQLMTPSYEEPKNPTTVLPKFGAWSQNQGDSAWMPNSAAGALLDDYCPAKTTCRPRLGENLEFLGRCYRGHTTFGDSEIEG